MIKRVFLVKQNFPPNQFGYYLFQRIIWWLKWASTYTHTPYSLSLTMEEVPFEPKLMGKKKDKQILMIAHVTWYQLIKNWILNYDINYWSSQFRLQSEAKSIKRGNSNLSNSALTNGWPVKKWTQSQENNSINSALLNRMFGNKETG